MKRKDEETEENAKKKEMEKPELEIGSVPISRTFPLFSFVFTFLGSAARADVRTFLFLRHFLFSFLFPHFPVIW